MSNKTIWGYACILYPEDIPDIPTKVLDLFPLYPCSLSPLHSPIDGKPHYHFCLWLKLSEKQKRSINSFWGYPVNRYFEPIYSPREMHDYLCHRGEKHKDKEQFAPGVVPLDSPLCPEEFPSFEPKGKTKSYLGELTDLIFDYEITEYCDFAKLLLSQPNEELKEYAFRHESKMKNLITSLRYRSKLYDDMTSYERLSKKQSQKIDELNNRIALLESQNRQYKFLLDKFLSRCYTTCSEEELNLIKSYFMED